MNIVSQSRPSRIGVAVRMALLASVFFLLPATHGLIAGSLRLPHGPRYLWITAIATTALAFYPLWAAKLKRRRLFLAREVTTLEEWYAEHYANTGIDSDVVRTVLESFAREAGRKVHCTQLLPTDRLDTEFALTYFGVPTQDPFETAEIELADRCGGRVLSDPDWQTIDDVIRGTAPLMQSRPPTTC
jgi:hypothetical protein